MSIITTPFAWLLLTLYNIVSNYGLAIILFALIVKLVLLPFSMKSKRGMLQSTRMQPRMKELEKKYTGNKAKYNEEVQRMYKEEKINPMSGCIWSLIPFPILLALYSVIRQPLSTIMSLSSEQITKVADTLKNIGVEVATKGTYYQIEIAQKIHENYDAVQAVVPAVKDIDSSFLGLNLSQIPNWKFFTEVGGKSFAEIWPMLGLFLIPILSAVLAFLSSYIIQKMTAPKKKDDEAPAAATMKGMTYMMPLISLWIGFVMPASIGVYWCATSFFTILQEIWLTKKYTVILDAQDAERREKERLRDEELERKRIETEKLKAEGATTVNPNTSKKKLQSSEKQTAAEKQAAWEAKRAAEKAKRSADESKIGDRPFARGRAYMLDRFADGIAPVDEETVPEAPTAEALPPATEDVTGSAGLGYNEDPEDYDDNELFGEDLDDPDSGDKE